jgi:catechol 2,3-dioxygenase-like lactoylglutathione lyase family enzyme
MSVRLNHTIVNSRDPEVASRFMAEILGLPDPVPFGPFQTVQVENDVTLDFIVAEEHELIIEHYAFLVSEQEFDEIFGRIRDRRLPYWADPAASLPNEINHHDGGRGVYFRDPSGHYLEIITRPYGSGGG